MSQDIKDILSIITPIILALIALLQNRMNKKQDKIQEQTDGKLTQLIAASNLASLQTGKLEGLAATHEDIPNDIAEDKSKTSVAEKGAVVDVKIVDQNKVIDVKETPDKK